jgi:hypothetical protein
MDKFFSADHFTESGEAERTTAAMMVAPIMTDLRIGVLPVSTGTRLILHPAAQSEL